MNRNIDTNTRISLHHAAQALAMFGRIYRHPEPDDSHTALDWDPQSCAFRVTLNTHTLCLVVESAMLEWRSRGNIERYRLAGCTRHEVQEEVRAWLCHAGFDQTQFMLVPPYDLPVPISFNAPFEFEAATLEALSKMYGESYQLLKRMESRIAGSSPVRTWPHHFDMAILLDVGREQNIGLGFSPGDSRHPQPYYYATPWPYPDIKSLDSAPEGWQWNTKGWIGLRREVPETGPAGFEAAFGACAISIRLEAIVFRKAH
jgi:hypothetical protein